MSKTLVIVESPGKIKKIQAYLGSNYVVKASFGHVYDLNPKGISVDVDNKDCDGVQIYLSDTQPLEGLPLSLMLCLYSRLSS